MGKWLKEETLVLQAVVSHFETVMVSGDDSKIPFLQSSGLRFNTSFLTSGVRDPYSQGLPSDEEDLVSSDNGSDSSSVIDSGTEAEDLVDELIARPAEEDIVDVPAVVDSSGDEVSDAESSASSAEDVANIAAALDHYSWLNGRAISVFVEAVIREREEDCESEYMLLTVWLKLKDVCEDPGWLPLHLDVLTNLLQLVHSPASSEMWLIPMGKAQHWTMAVIQWKAKQIWHLNKLPQCPDVGCCLRFSRLTSPSRLNWEDGNYFLKSEEHVSTTMFNVEHS
ncbi:hypothetical protein M422DRAFT_245764 [Sphaerobolus stellatus SS14]|nr:hypothetical protein M422DRAFT_245764 [Sphaerobolus stellatus SS14]